MTSVQVTKGHEYAKYFTMQFCKDTWINIRQKQGTIPLMSSLKFNNFSTKYGKKIIMCCIKKLQIWE